MQLLLICSILFAASSAMANWPTPPPLPPNWREQLRQRQQAPQWQTPQWQQPQQQWQRPQPQQPWQQPQQTWQQPQQTWQQPQQPQWFNQPAKPPKNLGVAWPGPGAGTVDLNWGKNGFVDVNAAGVGVGVNWG